MRRALLSRFSVVVLAALALPVTALAKDKSKDKEDTCTLERGPNDRVVKGQNLTIQSGEDVADAIAVDGDLVIRSGAAVENAIALNGSVLLEPGAKVRKSAIAFGGKLKVSKGATVGGSQISWSESTGFHIVGEDGHSANFNIKLDGKDLASEVLGPLAAKFKDCQVVTKK